MSVAEARTLSNAFNAHIFKAFLCDFQCLLVDADCSYDLFKAIKGEGPPHFAIFCFPCKLPSRIFPFPAQELLLPLFYFSTHSLPHLFYTMSGGEDSGLNGLGDNTYPALWWPELTKADKKRI